MKKKIIGAFNLLRPAQWLKNAFLFAPLIFSKHLFEATYFWRETLAFFGFCLVSSIVYIINDIADNEADKLHPIKRNRPLASGLLRLSDAVWVILILLLFVIYLIPYLNLQFWYTIILYGFLNLAYSFWLKQIVIVDVFIVAAGFMLRVLAGVFAIEVEISSWLILCTLFVSVFLAISKRRGELILSAATDSYASRPVLKQVPCNILGSNYDSGGVWNGYFVRPLYCCRTYSDYFWNRESYLHYGVCIIRYFSVHLSYAKSKNR